MKKRLLILGAAFVISTMLVAACGGYLKYQIFKPYELFQDRNVIELPFQLMADEGMRYVLDDILHAEQQPDEPEDVPPQTSEDTTVPPNTTVPDTTAPQLNPPETTAPETTPPETTAPPAADSEFDFSDGAVGDAWFNNVLFIGDSRTCGLRDCARSGNADYFCMVSGNVFSVDSSETVASDKNFSSMTLNALLSSKKYDKIFIGFGINECGYPISSFIAKYNKLIDSIQAAQPDAKIILQGIMAVSKKKAASASYFSMDNINAFNTRIANLADGEKVFYIDVNPSFALDDGHLPTYMSGDGVHLYAKYYVLWEQWIRWAVGQQNL
ncbi:MAG: hypothetical protein IJ422_02865 [Oscillospiraceae bacterium]|nr:hypothetical protein [Oscillospiraceae bacterium]